MLLYDPDLVIELHHRVWALDDREQAAHWGRPADTSNSGQLPAGA